MVSVVVVEERVSYAGDRRPMTIDIDFACSLCVCADVSPHLLKWTLDGVPFESSTETRQVSLVLG